MIFIIIYYIYWEKLDCELTHEGIFIWVDMFHEVISHLQPCANLSIICYGANLVTHQALRKVVLSSTAEFLNGK